MRVWTSKRSTFDLFAHRFKQATRSSDLLVSFKLMNGNPLVTNEADSKAPEAVVTAGHYTASDKQNVVCAADRYFVPNTGKCTINPFSPEIPVSYLQGDDDLHGYFMVLTSALAQSPLTLPRHFQPKIQNYWTSADAKTDSDLSSHRAASLLSLSTSSSSPVDFTLTATGANGHNWWQKTTARVKPLSCLALKDQTTGKNFNDVHYLRRPIDVPDPDAPKAINQAAFE